MQQNYLSILCELVLFFCKSVLYMRLLNKNVTLKYFKIIVIFFCTQFRNVVDCLLNIGEIKNKTLNEYIFFLQRNNDIQCQLERGC